VADVKMKYIGEARILEIQYAQASDFLGPSNPPVITFLLARMKGETPDSINAKLNALTKDSGKVRITIELMEK